VATAEEYATWIVANQARKDSQEFKTVAEAYKIARGRADAAPGQIPSDPNLKAPAAIRESSSIDELTHGAGLAVRAGTHAVTSIPGMLTDAATGVANQFLPQNQRFNTTRSVIDDFLTKYGLPAPQNSSERVLSDSVAAFGGSGSLSRAVPAVFGANAGTQALSAATGSLAGGVTRESGGSASQQLLASLAGAFAPSLVAVTGRGVIPNATAAGRIDNQGQLLNEAAGAKRPEILAALDKKTRFIPNETPNAAQSVSTENVPAFVATADKVQTRYRPDLKAELDVQNDAARRAAVRSIGEDKTALDAAINARTAAANANYSAAFNQRIAADPTLAVLATNPYFKDALPGALKLAKAKGITPKGNLTEFLHLVKLSLDDELSGAGKTALGRNELRAVGDVKDKLVSWMASRNKEYENARAIFAKDSAPINQMRIGQFLENKLASPLTGAERPGMFAQATRDAPGTIKRSLQEGPRYGTLDEVMTPPQIGLLGGVQSSLEREALTSDQALRGGQKAAGLLGATFDVMEPPPLLHRAITVARFMLEKIGVNTKNKTLEELASAVQDPTATAKLMREANPSQWAAIQQVMRAGAATSTLGAVQANEQTR